MSIILIVLVWCVIRELSGHA